ncbi:MAG: ABC transporter substrate-binding protein [Candidatus Eremiobacteraeota bacterium]|nr:ABC transporter substrate-binding protein [Candidatus Eremiobacteraeota bacterium]
MQKAGCLFIAIAFLMVVTKTIAAAAPLKKVVYAPQWLLQAQFAGYIMAKEKGFYEKRGLDVTILRGGPKASSLELLEKGKAQFATFPLTTGIVKREQGIALVNIAQILQKSGLMFIARKSSGISEPRDMMHRKVGIWDDTNLQLEARAFFRRHGLSVEMIPQSETMNLFLRGCVDVASATYYNEYDVLINTGLDRDDLTTFFFADYGIGFPQDGLYTLEKTFTSDNGALCRDFVAASLEGWRYAFANKKETIHDLIIIMRQHQIPASPVHQEWMLRHIEDLVMYGREAVGKLSYDDYMKTAQCLQNEKIIKHIPPWSAFYKDLTAHEKK